MYCLSIFFSPIFFFIFARIFVFFLFQFFFLCRTTTLRCATNHEQSAWTTRYEVIMWSFSVVQLQQLTNILTAFTQTQHTHNTSKKTGYCLMVLVKAQTHICQWSHTFGCVSEWFYGAKVMAHIKTLIRFECVVLLARNYHIRGRSY